MSKNKKTNKKSNRNRPRSKNNPDGERNNPPIDWVEYNKGRRAEGRLYTEWMREVTNTVRDVMDKPPGKRDWKVSAYWWVWSSW